MAYITTGYQTAKKAFVFLKVENKIIKSIQIPGLNDRLQLWSLLKFQYPQGQLEHLLFEIRHNLLQRGLIIKVSNIATRMSSQSLS